MTKVLYCLSVLVVLSVSQAAAATIDFVDEYEEYREDLGMVSVGQKGSFSGPASGFLAPHSQITFTYSGDFSARKYSQFAVAGLGDMTVMVSMGSGRASKYQTSRDSGGDLIAAVANVYGPQITLFNFTKNAWSFETFGRFTDVSYKVSPPDLSAVPLPPALPMFLAGLLCLKGIARYRGKLNARSM